MHSQHQRPSQVIAFQKKVIEEQENIIATLKGALAAAGGEAPSSDPLPWMSGLTRQESALVGALFRSYPRPIDKYELLELLPGYDHVEDRQIQVVTVKVHHIRKKLGGDAIENVWGFGYRLSARLHDTLRHRQTTLQAAPTRLGQRRLRLAA